MKEEKIRYSWPKTGDLDITVHGSNSATLRFTPAEIEKQVDKDDNLHKIHERTGELKAKGY